MLLKKAILALALFLVLAGDHVLAQSNEPLLIPIGGGYTDVFEGMLSAAFERVNGDPVKIVVLPAAYSSHASSLSPEERRLNLADAGKRRDQLETACLRLAPPGKTCQVILAPVLTRADAEDPANAALFGDDIAAVFILGGDQAIAMQALRGTPLEAALAAAYARGMIVAGTSAGLAVQSRTMIAGYTADVFEAPVGDDFTAEKAFAAAALQAGMVELWHTQRERGLSFGVTNAVLEQHFWERSRLPRLLNALAQPGVPCVGVGVDSYTGARLRGGDCLEDVFGLYTIGILDAETFGAAETATFDHDGVLSLRNVLFHTLAPGDFSYSLRLRQHSLAPTPASADRTFDSLALPEGAGPLILGGQINLDTGGTKPNLFIERLRALTGRDNPAVWVIGPDLIRAGGDLSQSLNDEVDAILVSFDDQAAIQPEQLAFLKAFWLSGKPLLLDDAAAALAGAFYAAHPPLPAGDKAALEAATQASLIQGRTDVRPGLGLLNILVEPRVAGDNRWGRLLSLAYAHPDRLAFGLNDGAALEITADGARVIGNNGVFRFDLRQAVFDLGTTGGLVIANGWLDVFAPGEGTSDVCSAFTHHSSLIT